MNKDHQDAIKADSKIPFGKRPNIDPDKEEMNALKEELDLQKRFFDNPICLTDNDSEGNPGPILDVGPHTIVVVAPPVSLFFDEKRQIPKTVETIRKEQDQFFRLPLSVVAVGEQLKKRGYTTGDKIMLKLGHDYEAFFYYSNIRFLCFNEHSISIKVNPDKASNFFIDYKVPPKKEEAVPTMPPPRQKSNI